MENTIIKVKTKWSFIFRFSLYFKETWHQINDQSEIIAKNKILQLSH